MPDTPLYSPVNHALYRNKNTAHDERAFLSSPARRCTRAHTHTHTHTHNIPLPALALTMLAEVFLLLLGQGFHVLVEQLLLLLALQQRR